MGRINKSIRWLVLFFLSLIFIDTITTVLFFSDYGRNNEITLYLFHIVYCLTQVIFSDSPIIFALVSVCSALVYIVSFILIILKKEKAYIIFSIILGADAILSVIIMLVSQNFIALSLIGILSKILISILCAFMSRVKLP